MALNLNKLNNQQKEAVKHETGPLLIIAGAGTGKTTVITQRVAYLIEQKRAKPEEILALTFTDKSATEMEERIDRLVEIGYIDFWVSTFHAFCERILRTEGLHIGLSTDFKLQDQTASWILVRENLDKFNLDYYKPLSRPTQFIHSLLKHFSSCKDQRIYPQDYLKYTEKLKTNLIDLPEDVEQERLKEVADSYHTYQKLLLDNNLLDFGDVINYCLLLFEKRPKILEKYRKQFKYILVDEFQDTNWAQYQLVKILASPNNNLTVCCDDFQAIYKFRGASFTNIIEFKKDFPRVKEVSLVKNYRSTQNILDLSYRFIKDNEPTRFKYFPNVEKQLVATTTDIGIIEHLHCKSLGQEARAVAEKIIELKNSDKEARLSDFAILARANNSAMPFLRALEAASIPYQFLAAKGLYQKPIVLDIISYFKLLDNYHESSALYRVLNLPFLQIETEDIMKIARYAGQKTKSIFEALEELPLIQGISELANRHINTLLNLIRKHSQMVKERKVSEILAAFLKDSGYLKHINQEKGLAEINALNKFYRKIKDFEDESLEPNLFNFMQRLNLELESGERGGLGFDFVEDSDSVNVMTCHGAKGLEFKYVFLVSMVDQRFPTRQRGESIEIPEPLVKEIKPEGDAHLQEERRLCYVAMTRTRRGLFFTSAEDYGGKTKKKLSRFLIEMGFTVSAPSTPTKLATQESRPALALGRGRASTGSILPKEFSYSQLRTYQDCPLKYKYSRVLGRVMGGKAEFSFGNTIHNTLRDFVWQTAEGSNTSQQELFGKPKKQGGLTFSDLLEVYEQKWIDSWYESKNQKEEYRKKGKQLLKDFYQKFTEQKSEIAIVDGSPALELAFNIKIGAFPITGKIDRVDQLSDGVKLIDYKTGKPKEKLSKDDKQQLALYQIAAEKQYGLQVKELTYYYLDNGAELSFISSGKDKQGLQEKVVTQITEMKKSDFPPEPGFRCRFCDFKQICQFVNNN